jgi:hypothetical protein
MAAGPAYRKLNLLYYGHGGVVFGHLVELVPEQLGVPAFACVAKPEQLPERTSHMARKGYDERYA